MDGELAGGITAIGKLRVRPAAEIKQSGISVGWECLDREIFDPEKCYEPLAEAGVKWARCQTGWNRCETVKGQYDFAWLDDIVDKLLRRGVQPWFNIGYGNKLYMPDAFGDAAVGSVPLYFGEETQTAWTNFVGALAKHFSGRVKRWEIWNESDNRNFWQPREPNPAEYARFLRLTAPLIRAAIPDAEIGACVSVVFNNGYVAPFIQTGIGDTIDFFSVHGYRLQPELNYAREITALRRLFDANKGGHVRIFQGESGYPSWFPPQHWLGNYIMESEENQAKWLLRRYITDFRLGVSFSSFFQMVDMMGKDYQMGDMVRKAPARHGLLNGLTYTRKMSWHAMAHLCSLFDSDTVPAEFYAAVETFAAVPKRLPRSRLHDHAAITAGFKLNGYPLVAYYVPEDVQYGWGGLGKAQVALCPAEAEKPVMEPVLVDMLDGTVYAVKEFSRDAAGRADCLQRLPLTDWPLLLTDRAALAGRWLPENKSENHG